MESAGSDGKLVQIQWHSSLYECVSYISELPPSTDIKWGDDN